MKNKFSKKQNIAIVDFFEGGAGQIHSWIEKSSSFYVSCFINPSENIPDQEKISKDRLTRNSRFFEYPTETSFKGRPLIHAKNWPEILKKMGINSVIIASGNNHHRMEQMLTAKKHGLNLLSAIHPTAIIMEETCLGENLIIHAGAFIGYRSEIGAGCIMNTRSQIDHHNVIGCCVSLDPGVTTAGNVTIGELASIHTRATIINKIQIGKNTIIGAGAVVITDIPENVTAVGIPARIIKHNG